MTADGLTGASGPGETGAGSRHMLRHQQRLLTFSTRLQPPALILLLPAAQGRGIGTAVTCFVLDHVFVHLNMHRISLAVFEDNNHARAVYACRVYMHGRGWRVVVVQ